MEISPGTHLLRDPISLVRPCATLQELPFKKTEMFGELFYTSQDLLPEGISVELQAFTNHCFFQFENTWKCMKGKEISCECSYSLRPFDLHEAPRDIRFRPNRKQKIYKVHSFYVEILAATNFSNGKLLRMNTLSQSGYGEEVRFSQRAELKPTPPVGLFQTCFPQYGTDFTYTDLQFPTRPEMENYYRGDERYRIILVLLADIGQENMVAVAARESNIVKVLDTDGQIAPLPPFCSTCRRYLD